MKQLIEDLKNMRDQPTVVPDVIAVTEVVVPTIQTVVPVLKDIVAPTLLSLDERVTMLTQTCDNLMSEVTVIRTEIVKITTLLASK